MRSAIMAIMGATLSLVNAEELPTLALEPSGPWVVQGEDNMCLLSRSFGEGAAKITIGFQPLFRTDILELIALTADSSTARHFGHGEVRLSPEESEFGGDYFSAKVNDKPIRLTRLTVEGKMFDALDKADSITLHIKDAQATVHLVRFAAARRAFDRCQENLLRSWGIDPAVVLGPNAPEVTGNPARFFGPNSYPRAAVAARISGRNVAVLTVSDTGSVASCRIVVSAGPILDEGTCKQAKFVRFKPAKDAGGRPVATIYVLPVRWMMNF